MSESEASARGILKRILIPSRVRSATVLLLLTMAIFIILRMKTGLPLDGFWGAVVDLGENMSLALGVLLLGYIAAYMLLRKEDELLSQEEVLHIAADVARQVSDQLKDTLRYPSLDDSLLAEKDSVDILAVAQREVCISRETGAVFFNVCKSRLKELLEAGRRVRIVLTHPDSIGAHHAEFRYSNSDKDFSARAKKGDGFLKEVCQGVKDKERIEIRYSSFALPSTVVIADPHTTNTRLLYRQIGHLTETNAERFSLELNASKSPRLSAVVSNEFDRIFRTSSKVVMLSDEDGPIIPALARLFPKFFQGHKAAGGQAGRSMEPLEEPAAFYLVIFPEESGGAHQTVLFGLGDRKASRRQWTIDGIGDKPKVSLDTLRLVRESLEDEAGSSTAVFIAGLDPVSLVLHGACERHEYQKSDFANAAEENQKFYERFVDSATGLLPLSIVPFVEAELARTDSHLFLHFRAGASNRRNDFYKSIASKPRTSSRTRTTLVDELRGTACAMRYAGEWSRYFRHDTGHQRMAGVRTAAGRAHPAHGHAS